jgi:hypothetical protein
MACTDVRMISQERCRYTEGVTELLPVSKTNSFGTV